MSQEILKLDIDIFKAPGSPLFCKSSDNAYGLAGVYFSQKYQDEKKVSFFAITGKWWKNFISRIVNGEKGDYRTLWTNPKNLNRKDSGSPGMKMPWMIWYYLFCLVMDIVATNILINRN